MSKSYDEPDSTQLIMDAMEATEAELLESLKRRAALREELAGDFPKDSLKPEAISRTLAGEGLRLNMLTRQHAALQKAWPA